MTTTRLMSGWLGAVMTVALVGCGGAQTSDVHTIGPQGGTIAVAGSALKIEIPAGALQRETGIRVREVEPRQGEVKAFEVEPRLDAAAAIKVTVKVDDAMGSGKHHLIEVENQVEHGVETEVEHGVEQEHLLFGEVEHLGHLGVTNDDGAAHDANDDNGAPEAQPADDKNTLPAPMPTPIDDKGTI